MNLRNVIKSYIVDLLTTKVDGNYLTLAEDRVYKDRKSQLIDENGNTSLPAICIYINSELATEYDNDTMKIVSSLVIECIADSRNSDDIVDAMSNQVEYLLAQDITLGTNVSNVIYTGGNRGADEEYNSDIVAWTMNYDVEYITPNTADASLLATLDKINVDYGNETTDTITYR